MSSINRELIRVLGGVTGENIPMEVIPIVVHKRCDLFIHTKDLVGHNHNNDSWRKENKRKGVSQNKRRKIARRK